MTPLEEDVLDTIADDHEELGQILLDVRNWHPALNIDEQQVITALEYLVESGLAHAFELSTTEPAGKVRFEIARARHLYFSISPKGKQTLAT